MPHCLWWGETTRVPHEALRATVAWVCPQSLQWTRRCLPPACSSSSSLRVAAAERRRGPTRGWGKKELENQMQFGAALLFSRLQIGQENVIFFMHFILSQTTLGVWKQGSQCCCGMLGSDQGFSFFSPLEIYLLSPLPPFLIWYICLPQVPGSVTLILARSFLQSFSSINACGVRQTVAYTDDYSYDIWICLGNYSKQES